MQLRGQIPANVDNVDKSVTALLDKEVRELAPIPPKLVKKETTQKKFERKVTVAPFGDVPEKPEGEEYAVDLIQQGNTLDVTPIELGMAFSVSETAEEDDLEDILAMKARFLVFSYSVVQEKKCANLFNLGFSTETTADAVALYSTAHTLKRGGTAKNTASSAADLSVTSLAQAFIDLDTDTKIESGQLVAPSTGFYLLVAPANRFNAMRIVKSALIPGEANNDINPMKDLDITVVVSPYLTDADAWFLVPKDKKSNGLLHLERKAVYQPAPATDPWTGSRLYKVRGRYVFKAVDWRNNYGNPGA